MAALLSVRDVAEGAATLRLDADGNPEAPLVVIDLDTVSDWQSKVVVAAVAAVADRCPILVGISQQALPPESGAILDALTCTLVTAAHAEANAIPRTFVEVADPAAAAESLVESVATAPFAALTLAGLLKITDHAAVLDGLTAESLAYSMLLAGPEFTAWRAATPRKPEVDDESPILLSREDDALNVVLNRPKRHNAFGHALRDGVVEALRMAELDPTIATVELSGAGKSFCSGGDLDEFGTAPNVSAAHLIRVRQSAGLAIHRCADRVRARLHGACIGAGIEVPAFAGRVEAEADTYFQLPELRMGLVPGAGGTVSITKRIGRWRTAYLALHGQPIDIDTALRWGLVDGRA